MKIVHFTVKPHIPERLKALDELAHNLWFSWDFEAIRLFIRLDYDAWLASNQNPVRMLGLVSQERMEEMSQDDSFLAALDSVYERFRRHIDGPKWYDGPTDKVIAYFSMEYGLDVSLPIYSGGLGILSGDHMKSSSDLGLPLVGIGLLYRQGYFRQYLNPDGFQQESYPENDWYNLPVRVCQNASGEPVMVSVELGGAGVFAKVWEVKVGCASLYLLDTNIPENSAENRLITDALYGGEREMRIRQEILLGIAGIRALGALGLEAAVIHMNEGHSAFLAIEKIRRLVGEQGFSFSEAVEAVRPSNVFTTHTPVPAGNERFAPSLMEKYFKRTANEMGLDWKSFLALGRENPEDENEEFCLTVLALKLSSYSNGVSRLHGEVSRRMWQNIWPGLPLDEVPISAITNGVHPRTWISHDMKDLLDRYFGPRFSDEPTYLDVWERMSRISDEELWRTHERRRERLVVFVRERMRDQLSKRGTAGSEISLAEDMLSPYALTICFARRFATYKRAALLLQDPDRLRRILTDAERPVQLIFAGKAHPHDTAGKDLIRQIIHFARDPQIRSRIVFLEDYDISIAKVLVSGSDIWLNTPRRPLEASGTSGMKAALNGVLNVSVLDGWWDEAYMPECGWAIGKGEEYDDPERQDDIEGHDLYSLLEDKIIPLFYARGRDGLPREWIRRMKSAMSHIGKGFSSQRMLIEYYERYYLKALQNHASYSSNGYEKAKEVAHYLERATSQWSKIRIECDGESRERILKAGEPLSIEATVRLGDLQPGEVKVELYWGSIETTGEITETECVAMSPTGGEKGTYRFSASLECKRTGRQGYAIRVLPQHPALIDRFRPGLITWAS